MDSFLNYTKKDNDNILRSIIELIRHVHVVLQVEKLSLLLEIGIC